MVFTNASPHRAPRDLEMRVHPAAFVQTANLIRKGLVDAFEIRAGQFI
jgi:hypothetical protein